MKANRMRFLLSRSLWTWAQNSEIESEMFTFKWTNSNGKQIFSDYVIRNMHTGASTTVEMTSQCHRLHLLNQKQKKH